MAGRSARHLLVVVAKEPVAGNVKTRMAPPLSLEEAASLYRCFLRDRIREMSGLAGHDVALAYAPEGGKETLGAMAEAKLDLFVQEGADLGERLHRIFASKLAAGYGAVSIVDSDTPDLPSSVVTESFRLLDGGADLVLGPSDDGGYYLVGLKSPCRALFAGIPWSTAEVLSRTLERAERSGLTTALLPPWRDLDTFADLLDFFRRHRGAGCQETIAPDTLGWLQEFFGAHRRWTGASPCPAGEDAPGARRARKG